MTQPQLAVEVFCSYAHEDELYRRQFETHLSMLKRQGLISLWYDHKILPGMNWSNAIDTHLEKASVIVLLLSADFIASDYCFTIEMKRALERHETGEARVVPVVIRPCDWQLLPVGKLQALPMNAKPISKWVSADEAWMQVTAGLRRIIEDLSMLSVGTPRSALPKVWMIPYPRNPFFLGRAEQLSQIYTQLRADRTTTFSQPQAISGLGGIGKTQIAVEYAYRYSQEYQVVLWAYAQRIETLNASYTQFAAQLNLPEKEEQEQEVVIRAIKKWLQVHRNWLLILDNADELDLLKNFLPPSASGHLLITTRAAFTGRFAQRIEVKTFTEEQGAKFLLRRASLLAPDVPFSQVTGDNYTLACKISHALGGLPLALDQAGAYLEQTGYSLTEYQEIYRQHQTLLLSMRTDMVEDHPDPVATTWSLSLRRVEQKSDVAVMMLRLLAYLSPDGIPLALIAEGPEPLIQDLLVLGQAIETLRAYSFVSHDPATRTLSLHRLVQTIIRNTLPEKEQTRWIDRAVRMVETTFPDPEQISQWSACERWLPHILTCTAWIEQSGQTYGAFREAGYVLCRAGHYLYERARYEEAEALYQRALRILTREVGWESDTLVSLHGLSIFYQEQQSKDRWAEGYAQQSNELDVPLLDEGIVAGQALYIIEHFHAAEIAKKDEDVPVILKTLAGQALSAIEYAAAERTKRSEHPDVASPLHGLAVLYRKQGRYEEAEILYQWAMQIRTGKLGPEHPDVAASLNGLANLYIEQGKYDEAETLYRQALQIWNKKLGPDHPNVAYALSNLAILHQIQGQYGKAEILYRRAFQIRKKKLGPEHPDVATVLNNLASLYQEQGKYKEAETLYRRSLRIWKQLLGADHPHTRLGRSNYIALLKKMGRDEEVRKIEKDS